MRCASSLYSPEPAAGASPLAPSVTPSSVTSSGKRTRKPSSKPASGTVIWTPPPSSATSAPSSGTGGLDAIAAEWISSLPVSPALPSASPGSGTVEPTSGTCGPRHATCFARFVPASPISKTSPDSYPWVTDQARLDGTSEPYLQTWPNSGWMRSGRCSELTTLGLRTGGSGYGSSPIYPTPSATEYGSSQNGINSTRPSAGTPSLETMARRGSWPTPSTAMNAGFTRDDEKRAAVSSGGHRRGHCGNELLRRVEARAWPTPRAEDSESTGAHRGEPDTLTSAVRLWHTPTSGDANSSGSAGYGTASGRSEGTTLTDAVVGPRGPLAKWPTPSSRDHKDGDSQSCANVPINALLGRAAVHGAPVGMKLNPAWVCWLMGWPRGWDALEPMEKEAFDEWLGRTEASAAALRRRSLLDLRKYAASAAPPQGPQPSEQLAGQHRDPVPVLPQGRAREGGGLGDGAGEASAVPDLWHLVSGGEDEAREGVLARVSEGDGAASCSEAMGRSSNDSPVHPVRGGVSEPNEIRDVQPFVREPSRLGAAPGWWTIDPGDTGEVPRTTTGCPDRRARLRAIGNGQVPACAAAAFRLLTEARPC